MNKTNHKNNLLTKLFVYAFVAVLFVILIIYLAGGRYITDENGNKFVGFTAESGTGRTLKSGTIYYADGVTAKVVAYNQTVTFANGETVSGACRIEFDSVESEIGNVYEGTMKGLYMDGKGRFTWENGYYYEGEFADDKKNGYGVLYWDDGSMYIGQFKDDAKNGDGVLIWDDCDTENPGKYEYDKLITEAANITTEAIDKLPEGTWFAGQFTDNKKQGFGIFKYAGGNVYCGNFSDNLKSGTGKLYIDANGLYDLYSGDFVLDMMSGHGVYTWNDGIVYEGDFAGNTMSGYGTYKWPNGDLYEGEFSDGIMNGLGKLTYAEEGKEPEEGIFENGKFTGKKAAEE